MASVKGITIGGRGLSTGFGLRACRVKGKGYAVIIQGSVLYGPTGTLQRTALNKAVVTKDPISKLYSIEPAGREDSRTIKTSGVVINEVHAFMPSPDGHNCRLCNRGRETQFHQL